MPKIQYTIRNILPVISRAVRKRSKQSGKSLNKTVVELLTLQTIGSAIHKNDQKFDWLFNKNSLDSSFDGAIESLSRVEKNIWQ